MKYWKQGFYDAPQGDAVEITEEYYRELLDGQSNGFIIIENEVGFPTLKNNAPSMIEEFRAIKVAEIWTYDRSDAVNGFTIEGVPMWLDKSTRSGLKLRFDAEKAIGLTDTSLWYENIKIPLNIDVAIGLLLQVELYASQSYDRTLQHITNVEVLTDVESVNNYDFTTGYPQKLTFAV